MPYKLDLSLWTINWTYKLDFGILCTVWTISDIWSCSDLKKTSISTRTQRKKILHEAERNVNFRCRIITNVCIPTEQTKRYFLQQQ